MTEEEIRVKVAEACGWQYFQGRAPGAGVRFQKEGWTDPEARFHEGRMPLPDFPNSLDACAEFERRIYEDEDVSLGVRYESNLRQITLRDAEDYPKDRGLYQRFITATPLQRCEAYLRTINTETR